MFNNTFYHLTGSLRMILFVMCLLYSIGSLGMLLALTRLDLSLSVYNPPMHETNIHDRSMASCGIVLGLIGAYGSFYKHNRLIKGFAIISALSILLIGNTLTRSLDDQRRGNRNMFESLQGDMVFYSWSHDYSTVKSIEATESWDGLQKLACCGVDGPNDWIEYRPLGIRYEDAYPSSCCIGKSDDPDSICTKRDILFKEGCSNRFAQITSSVIFMRIVGIAYLLALSTISFVVGYCGYESRSRCQPHQIVVTTVPKGQPIYIDQRIHQAPVSQQCPEGPMYVPNMQVTSTVIYPVPLPGYGTYTRH